MATEIPLYATPVLKSTGNPPEFDTWPQDKRLAYMNACAFDTPPGYEPPVIDDWWSE